MRSLTPYTSVNEYLKAKRKFSVFVNVNRVHSESFIHNRSQWLCKLHFEFKMLKKWSYIYCDGKQLHNLNSVAATQASCRGKNETKKEMTLTQRENCCHDKASAFCRTRHKLRTFTFKTNRYNSFHVARKPLQLRQKLINKKQNSGAEHFFIYWGIPFT